MDAIKSLIITQRPPVNTSQGMTGGPQAAQAHKDDVDDVLTENSALINSEGLKSSTAGTA